MNLKNYSNAYNKPNIIIIAGPTAVGKTETAIELAKVLNGEIISADSMQIYRDMTIGTAKPTAQEQAMVPHHLVDFVDPRDTYSVAHYAKDARHCIADIFARGKRPIIAGGTGLYMHSLIYNLDFSNAKRDDVVRDKLNNILQSEGKTALHAMLKARDAAAANRIHPNNSKRVMRALEILLSDKTINPFEITEKTASDFNTNLFILSRARAELYDRINRRVDIMLANGLVDEVKQLIKCGLTDDNQSMRGIGYKEVYQYLIDEIDYDQMVALLKRNSRRYAKRQLTWFKRYNFANWIDLSIHKRNENVIEYIIDKIA